MINKLLTAFNRNSIGSNPDFGEKIGNIGLGLLRIGFGKIVIIEKISIDTDKTVFTKKVHSTSTKVAAVVLFILAFPLTILLAGIGCIGMTFSKSHEQIFNSYNAIQVSPLNTPKDKAATTIQKAVKRDVLPISDLWSHLEKKSQVQLQGLEFLSEKDLNHRFFDIRCPRKTALAIWGQYLHANKVGEGIAQRSFVASQAPLEEDYEIFWKAIFEGNPIIFDLTTIKDQTDGGITKYYSDELNKIMKCGVMSVKLIEVSGRTYTYQIENGETGVVKNIKRYHYADWKDFGTVSLPSLHMLIQEVEALSPNPKDLLWIHCRAGVGRTGSLITALVLKEKIELGEINKENLDVSLVDIIVEFRKQRGPVFVQQRGQLELLREYANSLIML